MALQVWLPLNGDLTQQGLSNVTVTNNGATVDNNGKIGKCYSFGSDKTITCTSAVLTKDNNEWSIAVWAKGYGCLYSQRPEVNSVYRCIFIYSQNRILFDEGNRWDASPTYDSSKWNHFVFTRQGSKREIYINGALVLTNNNATTPSNLPSQWFIGDSQQTSASASGNPFNGQLNDFRIYDHCLSAKEVKELSKGLVLHYRLAGPGGENLFTNTSPLETKSNNEWIQLGNDTTAIFDTNGLIKYTVSFDAKSEIAGSFNLYSTSGSNPKYTWPNTSINLTTDWQHFSYTFTPTMSNSTGTWSRISIYGTYGTGKIPSIKNVKLERGSVQTPWCPNPADPLYSTFGYNNNIEYDCSGYNRNGTKNGTITLDADSPRYTTSYKMGGTGTSIVGPSDFSHLNTFTYSCWFNRKTTENAYLIMGYQYGNNSSGSLAVSKNGFAGFHCYRFSTGDAETHIAGNINYNDGKWHMLTVTYENNIIKVYVDGIKTAEKNNISLLTSNRTFVINYPSGSINNSEYRDYKGLLSDARVYATALSAEDIAELYHSAVIVDNTGKNYAYEYFEAN